MNYVTQKHATCALSAEELSAIISFLETTPAWLESWVRDLTEAQLRFKSDAFSIKENILHLRDIEIEGYSQRLRRMLEEDHPCLPDIDGARLALERSYRDQPLTPALNEFITSRRENIALLRTLTEDNLARTADLETVGTITLGELLRRWREHDAAHRTELEELRRQGKSPEPRGE